MILELPDAPRSLPSASTMERTLNCPAWFLRSRGLESPSHPWTEAGTRAHAILAGEEEDEEEYDLTRAVEICEQRVQQTLISLAFEDDRGVKERRLWLRDAACVRVFSGQPDRIYIEDDQAIIFDFKTGFNDPPRPSMNAQLASYAVLVSEEYGITKIILSIVPSWRPMPSVAEINAETIAKWRIRILEACAEAQQPNARAEAGEHCRYCAFRPYCPEAFAIVEEVMSMQTYPELTPEFYKKLKHAEATIEVVLGVFKAKLQEDPSSLPGLRIGKGRTLKTIPGSAQSFERLTDLYDRDLILQATKWSPAGLAKKLCPGKGQKQAREEIEANLFDLIEVKEVAGQIEPTE